MADQVGSVRVHIDRNVHGLYQELTSRSTSKSDPKQHPFALMKDVFMWAMAYGLRARIRRPIDGPREQIFRWDQFSLEWDIPLLRAVAIAETNDVDILLRNDEIISIAEEYANAGIHEFQREILDQSGTPLFNMLGAVLGPTRGSDQ